MQSERCQQPRRLLVAQRRAALAFGLASHAVRCCEVRHLGFLLRRWNLEQPFLMASIGGEERKSLDRVLGRVEVRDTTCFQRLAHFRALDRTQPCRQHGLARVTRDRSDRACRIGRPDRRPRHVQHDRRIDVRIGEYRGQGARDALRRRIGAHIHGIAAVAFGRKQRIERAKRHRVELGQADIALGSRVSGEKRRTATVRNDRDPVAARNATERENARRREKLRVRPYAHGTGTAHCSLEYGIRGGRVSARGRLVRAPGLEDDHRLRSRRRTQRGKEPPCVAYRFDVQQDAVGLAVEQHAIEHFAEVDVHPRAERHHRREADVQRRGEVEHRRADGTGLRNQRKTAAQYGDIGDRRIEADVGAHQAERTRPHEPDAAPRRELRNVSRPFALLGSVSGRRIGEQNRRTHTGVRAIVEYVADRTRGCSDDCEIDSFADRTDPGPGLAAEHFAMSGVDRVQVARKRAGKCVLEHDAPQRPRSFGRTDQRNAAWQQQRSEIVLLQPIGRHGVPAAGISPALV